MCGIAGLIGDGSETPPRQLLDRMCRKLVHRGPDADGAWIAGDVALGHRRLSIIDVSGGDQPIANEDGTVRAVFNGEIYNYRELRAELIKRGHRFRTESDTEVLVHLYEDEGEQMPEFLNGMFAFAIWDSMRRRLLLARDRVGKKPLYYTTAIPGFRMAFASELKALVVIPGFPDAIDPRSMADYLALSYVPDPQTIYRDVYKLEPAHTLILDAAGVHKRKYWHLKFGEDRRRSMGATIEEIRVLAADAVKRRMISDVPLGAFLSGGVDSSAVIALMAQQQPAQVRTFSIGFTDKRYDELQYAREVAQHCGTDHNEQIVSPKIEEALDMLAAGMDEPFADSSIIPTLYLAQMTRRQVTVALSGDGADEVFGGYRRYYFGVLEERLRRLFPDWFRKTAIGFAGRHYPKLDFLPQVFRAKSLLTNIAAETGDAYFSSMTVFRDAGLQAVLSPEMRTALGGYDPRMSFRDRFTAVRHLSPLEQMQKVDFDTYLPGDILVKVDRATMAHSLETRSPWLDYRLVELASSLPWRWKIQGTTGKAIFKQAVLPMLPRQNVTRPKMGFSVPLAEWFRGSLKPLFAATVLQREAESVVSLTEVRRLWKEHQSGLVNHDRKLWTLLMLGLWKKWVGSSECEEAVLRA
jgi:asparagine synthase (glutamine-hydrolysing)